MSKLLWIKKGVVDGEHASTSIFLDSLKITLGEEVFVYDLEGRPHFIYTNNMLYERGLSGEIIEKKWISLKPPRRHIKRILDQEYKEALLTYAIERSIYIMRGLGIDPDSIEPRINFELLEKIRSEEKVFKQLYKPISILPPDQYLSLVLQPLEGCPYNKCSFCTFYRDRSFRFKSIEEFREHVSRVVDFLGKGIYMRRRVFLADANALFADTDLLVSYISTIREILPGNAIEGIYSFSDYFTVYKTIEDLKTLRRLGYKRVYIGLESGNDDVLRILSKPGPASRSVELVKRLKASGIDVGLIVLIGAGGREYYHDHVRDTVKVINMMPLNDRDIIYFSKLKIHPDSEYLRLSKTYGLTEIEDEEMDRQIEEIKKGIRHDTQPIYAIYDIDETIY